jgi:hypothetical protein
MRLFSLLSIALLFASCTGGDEPEKEDLSTNSVVGELDSESAPNPEPFDSEGYGVLDFTVLGEFEYPIYVKIKEGEELPPIPDEVRVWDGKKVAITGFMNPVRFDREGVSEFLLVKDILGCCFGATPRMNHWIRVRMREGERAKFYAYDELTIFGALEVSEEIEDGYVMSVYRMTVHHLAHED